MPFVSVPKDLGKVKTKVAFNLTRRQLVCFSAAGAIGIPTYLFTRPHIGNETAVLLMVGLMLPFFFLAMYERDGLTMEKVARNILRSRFLRPKVRPYQTRNLYLFLNDKEVPYADQPAKKAGKKTANQYPKTKGGQKGRRTRQKRKKAKGSRKE